MALPIISPQHSFVNLQGALSSFVMPAYESYAVAFQFMLPVDSLIGVDDPITVDLVRLNNSVAAATIADVQNICSWGRIAGATFPMTINADQQLPVATYNTLADFLAYLKTLGLAANGLDFMQCCGDGLKNIYFSFNGSSNASVTFYKGLQQVTIPDDIYSTFTGAGVSVGECFKYCILHGTDKVYSNVFKRVGDSKYLTRVTYSCNEDAYGFRFPSTAVFNQVWLPLLSKNPKYPEARKVYIKSDKSYKVQSSVIEKEFDCKTDRLTDIIHEKIAIMLGMDNVEFLNEKISGFVYKKDDYNIDWEDEEYTWIDTAVAKFKVSIPFAGRNSNCEKKVTCTELTIPDPFVEVCDAVSYESFSLPDGIVGDAYYYLLPLGGDGPFIKSAVTKPGWMNITVVDDTVLFTGRPTDAATGVAVSLTISNCDGAHHIDLADTIDITAVEMDPPADKSAYVVNDTHHTLQVTSNGTDYPGSPTTGNFAIGINAGIPIIINSISGSYLVQFYTSLSSAPIFTGTFAEGDNIPLSADPSDAATGINNINYIKISQP